MSYKHGGDIYSHTHVRDFSANINFRGMPARVREAAIRAVDASVHYPDPECRILRQALAARETVMYGAAESAVAGTDRIGPEHIICGNGAAELMFAFAGALRPMRALLAVPSFFEYEQALDAFGCELTRFQLKPEQDFRLGEEFLERVASFARSRQTGNTGWDVIILGNPNNPTGALVEEKCLRTLIRLCREAHIFLVLDESFMDFLNVQDQAKTISGAREIPENGGIFVIRSFTKIYAMPGIRFGYGLCADRQLLADMHRLLQPWNVSLVAQKAATAAASEYEFARSSAAQTAVNREVVSKTLADMGLRVFPSSANFLLFQAPAALGNHCLARGFLIRDCGNFPGLEPKEGQPGMFRICVRSQEENEALLHTIGDDLMREQRNEVNELWRDRL